MILFLNVIFTEQPPIPPFKDAGLERVYYGYDRGNLSSWDQIDIFKYSLASLAVAYPWSKVVLKITLEDKYLARKDELKDFIEYEFKFLNYDKI
jgi:hypothetical protein